MGTQVTVSTIDRETTGRCHVNSPIFSALGWNQGPREISRGEPWLQQLVCAMGPSNACGPTPKSRLCSLSSYVFLPGAECQPWSTVISKGRDLGKQEQGSAFPIPSARTVKSPLKWGPHSLFLLRLRGPLQMLPR